TSAVSAIQQIRNRISSGARSDGYLSTSPVRTLQEDRAGYHLRNSPPSAPRTSARPTEPPIEPPSDLPRSATAPPTTLLVTERVTLRAISWPVDNLPRETLVPKMVPTIAPIWPRTPPPAPAASAGAAVPARRFCSSS